MGNAVIDGELAEIEELDELCRLAASGDDDDEAEGAPPVPGPGRSPGPVPHPCRGATKTTRMATTRESSLRICRTRKPRPGACGCPHRLFNRREMDLERGRLV
jgi:hypothetical protein